MKRYSKAFPLVGEREGGCIRYYFGSSCGREVVAGVTTQYLWIGGDAYTAVAVAKKVGTGSWTVYNIFRDHLGTITHLKNGTNPADEYSFDAWGRRRDKDTWSYTLDAEPILFADRGFTGHEYLEDFKLYNMNGRLYDPVVGRFLSPDPYIQDPGSTQSMNRYSYCLNNPLKFNDPSGEFWNLLFVWGGNYVINWLDNTINKKMSPQQAFKQPIMLSGNYSPSANQFSNCQIDAFKGAKQEEKVARQMDVLERRWSGAGSPGWEFYVGTGASAAQELYYSEKFGTWMGKNFTIYQQTWGGNGIAGGKNNFGESTSNAIKWGGRALGVYNAYSVIRQRKNGQISDLQFVLEQASNAYSAWGSLYGASWGVGWQLGRSISETEWYQKTKFNFYYNYWENQVGVPSQQNEDIWFYFYQNYKP